MTVKHQPHPIRKLPTPIHHPKRRNQIIFTMKDTAPALYLISFPKGKKDSMANLKHCIPSGNPIMVIHNNRPDNIYARPLRKPPKMNHRIFPNSLIIILSFLNQERLIVFLKNVSRKFQHAFIPIIHFFLFDIKTASGSPGNLLHEPV